MTDPSWSAAGGGVRVARLPTPDIKILRLRGDDDDVLRAVDDRINLTLPRVANRVGGTGSRALWLAPSEWMLVDCPVASDDIVAAAIGAGVAHVAEIGEGRAGFAVSGPCARDLIAKGCPIDLHPCAFGTGRCAQSLFAQVFAVIEQVSDAPVFNLYADVGYAHHLETWFADALVEFRDEDVV